VLLVSSALLIYALGASRGVLQNRFTKYFASISMEVYLSHMVMFRAIEKLHINTMFGNGWFQYVVTVVLTIGGAVVFSVVIRKGIEIARGIVLSG
jgi:peptidoglycan/LPS O-acetylase OafA/YrhL